MTYRLDLAIDDESGRAGRDEVVLNDVDDGNHQRARFRGSRSGRTGADRGPGQLCGATHLVFAHASASLRLHRVEPELLLPSTRGHGRPYAAGARDSSSLAAAGYATPFWELMTAAAGSVNRAASLNQGGDSQVGVSRLTGSPTGPASPGSGRVHVPVDPTRYLDHACGSGQDRHRDQASPHRKGCVEQPVAPQARHRRVAGQGEDHRGLPRRRLRRRGLASATSATCRTAPESRPNEEGAVGTPRRRRRQRLRALYVVDARQEDSRSPSSSALLKDADELYLATDEDREGEAIAWHLLEVLKPQGPGQAGWSSTRSPATAIQARRRQHARASTRHLVDAQETRRILDRLYGYEVSPGAVAQGHASGLSAGRVQSVATRLVVERERERMAFVAGVVLGPRRRPSTRGAERGRRRRRSPRGCARVDGKRVAQGRDFDDDGAAQGADEVVHLDEAAARGARRRAAPTAAFAVALGRGASPTRRRPARRSRPRRCSRRPAASCGFSAQRTMQVAQRLYENGYITYMRTDSHDAVGDGAHGGAHPGPRAVRRRLRARRAARLRAQGQERAGGARGDPPLRRPLPHAGADRRQLRGDEFRLYELIWKRTVASQMTDATGSTASPSGVGGDAADGRGRRVLGQRHASSPSTASWAYEEGKRRRRDAELDDREDAAAAARPRATR